MSSHDRLLLHAEVADDGVAPVLVSVPQLHLDDRTRSLLAEERARGLEEGHARGLAEGRGELAAAADGLRDQVLAALESLAVQVRDQHEVLAVALEQRVVAAVTAVLGHEPTDGHRLVADLVRVVAQVDSPTLEVRVPAVHEALAREALVGTSGVEVVVDETLGPDDVRVHGAAVDVDLRRSRLLEELTTVLAAGAPLGPLDPEPDAGVDDA